MAGSRSCVGGGRSLAPLVAHRQSSDPGKLICRMAVDWGGRLDTGGGRGARRLVWRRGIGQEVEGGGPGLLVSASPGEPAMARRSRQWPLRLVGSLFGLAAGAVGLFSLLAPESLTALEHERAQGFGIAAFVVGAVALIGSLATRDVHALWYCSPRRWRAFRADLREGSGAAPGSATRVPLRPTDDTSAGP
jgi:hypothetical protein